MKRKLWEGKISNGHCFYVYRIGEDAKLYIYKPRGIDSANNLRSANQRNGCREKSGLLNDRADIHSAITDVFRTDFYKVISRWDAKQSDA